MGRLSDSAYQQVLAALRELASVEFQERVWVEGSGPEVSTPSELVSQLFDDTGLGDLLEKGGIGNVISPEVDQVLVKLSRKIDEVDFSQDARTLIRGLGWRRVRALAAEAYQLCVRAVPPEF